MTLRLLQRGYISYSGNEVSVFHMLPKRIEVEQILVSLGDTSHYLIGKDYKVSVAVIYA